MDASKKDLRAEGLAQLNKFRNKKKKGPASPKTNSSPKASTTPTPVIAQPKEQAKEVSPKPPRDAPSVQVSTSSTSTSPALSTKVASPSVPVFTSITPTINYSPASTPPLQIQPSSSEVAQKLKMLQQTNTLLGTQNQTLSSQLKEYETRIWQLEQDQQNLLSAIKTAEASKTEAEDTIRKLIEKHTAELAEYKDKDTEITSLKNSLAQLQSKYDDEVRLRQSNQTSHEEEMMPLRGQLKLIELEKKQAEREKMGAEFQLKEATQNNMQLQNNVAELNKRVVQLETQLASSNTQLNSLLTNQAPTERELRAKELEIERLVTNHTSEIQRLNNYCKQLEIENVSLSSQNKELTEKVKHSDEILSKEISAVRTEYRDIAANHEQQTHVIEKLMAQKRCIMQQLTREVERNGALVKENLEAKQAIALQQQMLIGRYEGQDPPLARDISLSLTGAPRVGIPQLLADGRVSATSTPTKARTNGTKLVYQDQEHRDTGDNGGHNKAALVKYNGPALHLPPMVKDQPIAPSPSKGWLASIPLLGRLWTPKSPVQQTMQTVVI